jgi:tetratricopeptide (TPR) repeat protein
MRRSDIDGATREAQAALTLHSDDPEATELLQRLQATHGSAANLKSIMSAGGFDPTTRIHRTWSEASFRQAAFQLDQMRAIQMASLPADQQAVQYTQLGTDYLAQGLLPEAEQEFNSAIAANPKNALAHAGIAQVRERSGSTDDARAEAQNSLHLAPNPTAYMVLARIDLQANQLSESAFNVGNALRLEPDNPEALTLKKNLADRGQNLP